MASRRFGASMSDGTDNVTDVYRYEDGSPVHLGKFMPPDVQEKISELDDRVKSLERESPGGGGGTISVSIPVGGIIAFSGSFGGADSRYPIPLGGDAPDERWILCDGTMTNGLQVPDLRGRMIIGVSDGYTLDSTGGAETHTHTLSATAESAGSHSHGDTFSVGSGGAHTHTVSGSVGATTLTISTMPSHSHQFSGRKSGGSLYQTGSGATDSTIGTATSGGSSSHSHTLSSAKTASAGGHSHTISGSVSSGGAHTHTVSGSAAATSNLPPYYALAFIMRIA